MSKSARKIARIAQALALAADLAKKTQISEEIWNEAYKAGVYPSSINDFYRARGREG